MWVILKGIHYFHLFSTFFGAKLKCGNACLYAIQLMQKPRNSSGHPIVLYCCVHDSHKHGMYIKLKLVRIYAIHSPWPQSLRILATLAAW